MSGGTKENFENIAGQRRRKREKEKETNPCKHQQQIDDNDVRVALATAQMTK
jgi:hypothetical protein